MNEEQRRIVYMTADNIERELGNSGIGKTSLFFYILETDAEQFNRTKNYFMDKKIQLIEDPTSKRFSDEEFGTNKVKFHTIAVEKTDLNRIVEEAQRIEVKTVFDARDQLRGMETFRQYANKGGINGQSGPQGQNYEGRQ